MCIGSILDFLGNYADWVIASGSQLRSTHQSRATINIRHSPPASHARSPPSVFSLSAATTVCYLIPGIRELLNRSRIPLFDLSTTSTVPKSNEMPPKKATSAAATPKKAAATNPTHAPYKGEFLNRLNSCMQFNACFRVANQC